MKNYELLLIISGKVKDSDVPGVIAELKKLFSKHGATVVDEAVWGRMKLAYEIKHELQGSYVLWHLSIDPSKTRLLDQDLRVTDHVLRFLLIEAPTHGRTIIAPNAVPPEENKKETSEPVKGSDKPRSLDAILEEKI